MEESNNFKLIMYSDKYLENIETILKQISTKLDSNIAKLSAFFNLILDPFL